jgi:hypothetical protein
MTKTDIPAVLQPATGSPSPIKVKAAKNNSNSMKYQKADNSHFHQFICNPKSFAQKMAAIITAPERNPIINAKITRFVIMN